MDPKALTDELVANAPSGKFGEPHMLEIQGLRNLVGAFETDAEISAAVQVFQDRLEELTGYRAPDERLIEPVQPQPSTIPMPPVLSPEELARSLIAQTFSAPFDGTEERIEVFASRARGSVAELIRNGLDPSYCEAIIEEMKAELRTA